MEPGVKVQRSGYKVQGIIVFLFSFPPCTLCLVPEYPRVTVSPRPVSPSRPTVPSAWLGAGLYACRHAAKQGVPQRHPPSAHGGCLQERWGLRLVPKKNPQAVSSLRIAPSLLCP
jgi:hypothetical protein